MKYLIILFLLFLYTCTGKEEQENINKEPVGFHINLNSLIANTDIRIIIADAASGKVLANDYPVKQNPYEKKIRPGDIHIYALGNEPDRLRFPLSVIDHEDGILPLIINYDEIPKNEIPEIESPDESNLPLFKKIEASVRMKDGQPGKGEISTDNGNSWAETLDIVLDRLGVKLSMKARKKTDFALDDIKIEKIRITNIPRYAYLMPQEYPESDFYLPQYPFENGSIELKTGDYDTIFKEFIIPEYILSDPTDLSKAININIHALFNAQTVMFSFPLPGEIGGTTYSLVRNHHHEINVTIISSGGAISSPEIEYRIAGWGEANNPIEISKIVQFRAYWAPSTSIQGNNIYVSTNEAAEFKFTLANPQGARWTATITNPVDFYFDNTDGAVSAGLAGDNMERTIRIRPLKSTARGNAKTSFYITVNYGSENIELNLPDEQVGSGNHYIITQIPD